MRNARLIPFVKELLSSYLVANLEQIKNARIIIGVDRRKQSMAVFYGRERMFEIIAAGIADDNSALVIRYDNDSEQLEILAGVVQVLKGRCDYLSSAEE